MVRYWVTLTLPVDVPDGTTDDDLEDELEDRLSNHVDGDYQLVHYNQTKPEG